MVEVGFEDDTHLFPSLRIQIPVCNQVAAHVCCCHQRATAPFSARMMDSNLLKLCAKINLSSLLSVRYFVKTEEATHEEPSVLGVTLYP